MSDKYVIGFFAALPHVSPGYQMPPDGFTVVTLPVTDTEQMLIDKIATCERTLTGLKARLERLQSGKDGGR